MIHVCFSVDVQIDRSRKNSLGNCCFPLPVHLSKKKKNNKVFKLTRHALTHQFFDLYITQLHWNFIFIAISHCSNYTPNIAYLPL